MSRTPGGENQRAARIAVFLPTLGGGGVERVLLMLAEGFVQRGLSVDLLLARAEGPFLESVPKGVRLVDFSSRMTVTSLPRLLRYLKRVRPDVLVAASNAVIPALIARRFFTPKTPTLARQDNTHTMQARTANLKMRMALRLIRYLLPSADAVIAVSSGVAEDLGRTIPGTADLVRVVPNPVIGDELDDRAAEPVGHPWLSDPGVPVILSAGRLVPQKDHPTLLRAFAEVVRSRPARLVVLGEGPDRERLTALARELGIADLADFPGFVDNPYSYMSRAGVFALSSVTEGLPTALIEAMACGTPVVSTDCPSGPGEILEDGRWGRLVPVGDWQSLAKAIADTLDSPPAPDLLKSRAQAYSVRPSVDRHLQLAGAVIDRCD